MEIHIRHEEQNDYRAVEELTREAFWNVHVPGCNEHFLLHELRRSDDFIPALDFVAEADGKLVGHIVYSRSAVTDDAGVRREVATFGPVSVRPEFQKSGVGSALIRHSLAAAAEMGFPAVLIYGDPRYYCRFGFRCAERYDISSADGKFSVALMALPLHPGGLDGIAGRFEESPVFNVDDAASEVFDATFPKKEKGFAESQMTFQVIASLRY
jgi:predicted N-acetyltransferase YhbS